MDSPQAGHVKTRSPRLRWSRTSRHREQVLELGKNRSATTSSEPYQRHLYSSMRWTSPKLASARLRLSPLLARTLRPGARAVPREERLIPATLRSSTTMRRWLLASLDVSWWR
jgi:hypothetical protein